MAAWSNNNITGSINREVAQHLRDHFRENVSVKRFQRTTLSRMLRQVISQWRVGRLLVSYLFICSLLVGGEAYLSTNLTKLYSCMKRVIPDATGTDDFVLSVSSYLLNGQVGVLAAMSIAIALVILLSQQGSSRADIRLFYNETLAFSLFSSSFALLIVLSIQFIWPIHFFFFGVEEMTGHVSRFGLLWLHVIWLVVNFFMFSHLALTTFSFVEPTKRQALRKKWVATEILRQELRKQLRHQIFSLADDRVCKQNGWDESQQYSIIGYSIGGRSTTALTIRLKSNYRLEDVRLRLLAFAIGRWVARSQKSQLNEKHFGQDDVRVSLPAQLDRVYSGDVVLCERIGGVPLNRIERNLFRIAFQFRKLRDG